MTGNFPAVYQNRVSCNWGRMLSWFALQKIRGGPIAGAILWSSLATAQLQDTPTEPTQITCTDGLYLIYAGNTHSCTDREFLVGKSANTSDAWRVLWDAHVGVLRPPEVDFSRYVVISFVAGYDQELSRKMAPRATVIHNDGTLVVALYAERLKLIGPLVVREPHIWSNTVWFMAIPRSRLPGHSIPKQVDTLVPWLELDDYPRDFDPLKTRPPDEESYLPKLTPEQFRAQVIENGESLSWRDRTHWEGAVALFGGIGTGRTKLFGPDLKVGASRTLRLNSDDWGRWLGNEWGLELRGWLGMQVPLVERSMTVGIRPWIARAEHWGTEWLSSRRHPTLLGSIIPEFGMMLQQGNSIEAYVAWSAPFQWHRSQFYYRTAPYLLREHSAFEVRPGLLWLPNTTNANVLVTLSIGYGLW